MKLQRLKNTLNNDIYLRIYSVIIAIIIWFLVTVTLFPTATGYAKYTVNLDLTGTTAETMGLIVTKGNAQTVTVKFKSERINLSKYSADDFIVTPSLNSVVASGEYDIALTATAKDSITNPTLTDIAVEPSTIKVSFDKIVKKVITLTAEVSNAKPASGFIMDTPTCSPSEVTITGPETDVNQIDHCVVSAALDGELSEPHTTTGTLQMFDSKGNRIKNDNLTPSTSNFTVNIPVYMRKTLPLKVEFRNVPNGFPLNELEYSMSSKTIDLAAPSDSIANVGEITLGNIDLRDVDIGSIFSFEVPLATGYQNLSGFTSVLLTFPSENMVKRTFEVSKFSITNPPAEYNVQVVNQVLKNVTIIGQKEIVDKLTPLDILAEVDLLNITVFDGEQSVPVKISVPNKGAVWAYGPYSVNIKATKK